MGALYGRCGDGRQMRIRFDKTIFGNAKVVLEGLGENMLGWSGWAHCGTFKRGDMLRDAIRHAQFVYDATFEDVP